MPPEMAIATARFRNAVSPLTINPPTSPHPNPMADTFSPVLPNTRYSIEFILPRPTGRKQLTGTL